MYNGEKNWPKSTEKSLGPLSVRKVSFLSTVCQVLYDKNYHRRKQQELYGLWGFDSVILIFFIQRM